MSAIYDQLRADIVAAMKNRDTDTTLKLRTSDAAIQRASMDLGKPIDDDLVVATLRKSIKKLADAKAEFAKAGRDDLANANEAEIALLEKYVPQMMDASAVEVLVDAALAETGATTRKEMGRVIGTLKKHPDASRIDFVTVSKLVQSKLG